MNKPNIDERIIAIRDEYGLSANDLWELPQKKGTWVAKHAALEVVAAKAKITFDMPQIIEANGGEGVAAVCVRGFMGDRSEWSIGECSPKNNRNAYPFAMAEKRGKDRVILKLIGIHGLIYSEDEMSGSSVMEETEAPKQLVKDSRAVEKEMRVEVDACSTVAELEMLWLSKPFQTELGKLHQTYRNGILDLFKERKGWLAGNPARINAAPNFDEMENVR